MTTHKSDKELAFLQDLFIAPNWGERFAELIDEHITLPEKGNALYLAIGTGGHALALQERAGADLKFLCLDENQECLELARAKATAMKEPAKLQPGTLDALDLKDDQFDLVLGDGVTREIARLINEERHNAEFSLTVKATLVVGRKARLPLVA